MKQITNMDQRTLTIPAYLLLDDELKTLYERQLDVIGKASSITQIEVSSINWLSMEMRRRKLI